MIELESISKRFTSDIFKDFSFTFEKKNIYFLSGRNGSGKTTLLKIIKGIYLCDDGKIRFEHNLSQKSDIAYIDANSKTFFHRLTVYQNLQYFLSLQNKYKYNNSINYLLNLFHISNLKNEVFSSLSQGQMQLVSIIRGLSSNPKIILLDEVFLSLDQTNKKMILRYLSEFVLKEEALVIFTSHEDNFDELVFKELHLN